MSKPGIFVSYRRDDSAFFVRPTLGPALQAAFPDHPVFIDADLGAGDRFPQVIRDTLQRSHLVLAVMGRHWVTDRLQSPTDWVRQELEQAFDQRKRTIPLLVGADLPPAASLPESLRPLRDCHALRVTVDRVADDLQGVIVKLRAALAEEAVRMAARPAAVPVDPGHLSRQEALAHWHYINERGLSEVRLREHLDLFPNEAITARMARDALADLRGPVVPPAPPRRRAEGPRAVEGLLGAEVWVPEGTLVSENWTEPQAISAFKMMVTPVTEAQWQSLMGEQKGRWGASCPVTQVRWGEAVAFCNALSDQAGVARAYRIDGAEVHWDLASPGYRLPTEREWEYACRAGTSTPWSWGDDPAGTDAHAWHHGNSGRRAHPVRTKAPNPWGLHDLHGNVWEWCWTTYERPAATAEVTLSTNDTGANRVHRGGSFRNEPTYLRSAYRNRVRAELGSSSLGFRCVSGSRPQP